MNRQYNTIHRAYNLHTKESFLYLSKSLACKARGHRTLRKQATIVNSNSQCSDGTNVHYSIDQLENYSLIQKPTLMKTQKRRRKKRTREESLVTNSSTMQCVEVQGRH